MSYVERGAWHFLNPFLSNATFLYPLKMSENLWFSDVFRGYRNMTLDKNGLRIVLNSKNVKGSVIC